jgi:excinuclease ABC subunit C
MLTKEMMADLPSQPGVYFFRNKSREILYIGKAKSLRKRVNSYLYNTKRRPHKIKRLVRHASGVDYEICNSELEASLLEARLIKENQPPYNSALKEGWKSWFIRIDHSDDFPRLQLTSEQLKDGARYFGPFSGRKWTEDVINSVHHVFPVRTCEQTLTPRRDTRPCLSHYLKRCDAPCADRISREAYRAMINDVEQLLEGDHEAVVKKLMDWRDSAATNLHFERAAVIQKRIEYIQDAFVFLDVHRWKEQEVLSAE